MARPGLQQRSDELNRLMLGHMESVKEETFVGLSKECVRWQEELIKRTRAVSADFLAALKPTLQ